MATQQIQTLMPEGELVKIIFNKSSYWAVYEGVVEGEDSFVKQHYSRGYQTRMLNSMRFKRDLLQFDAKKTTVASDYFRLVRYDTDNSKNLRLSRVLEEKGIWEEPIRRR